MADDEYICEHCGEMHPSVMCPRLYNLPQLPQSQTSVIHQLRQLALIATRFGLYDAADYLNQVTREHDHIVSKMFTACRNYSPESKTDARCYTCGLPEESHR